MASGDIVPIELGLTDGDLVTLWAPRWRDGEDEWEAFLGHEDALYGFDSVAELVAFIRTNDDNDLVDHPAWKVIAGLSAAELEPEDEHIFDLVAVPELAAGDPDPDAVAELEATLDMARTIGDVCELEVVTKFFDSHKEIGALSSGMGAFFGREGEELWGQIGAAIVKDWDEVVDAIDAVVKSPEVDAEAVSVAEAELLAAEQNIVDAEDAAENDEDDEIEQVDLDAEDEEPEDEGEETFWHGVGIDPVRIVTSEGQFFTLRCYLDDEPVFLGSNGQITVFSSERALARYLADDHDHDLAAVSTYGEVHTAAIDGSLEVEVSDENVYVLPGLADDLGEGPEAVDLDQLDLAVELFTDAADYADDDTVEQALTKSTSLGSYVSYLLEPDPGRMAPSAPFAAEAEAWRVLERAFETRLNKG
ncbi:primosomal protein [Nocardia sp. CA2R105]|uniref:primosomal protein n=1 Tax=Nocardia coffeae TaxID=2873381 RepID=UPI001CA69424|nr:primosomal protein [Nocardia coffeae]MBY8858095.1 primosomal protein [Nocardia coffeae]